ITRMLAKAVDKAAVDFDPVDIELLQSGERREPSSEIVQGKPDAKLPQRLDILFTFFSLGGQCTLSDLQFEMSRICASLHQDAGRARRVARLPKLKRRNIHGHGFDWPILGLLTGLVQDPITELMNKARFFGDGDEY